MTGPLPGTGHLATPEEVTAEIGRQRRQFQRAPGFIAILHGPEHLFDFVNDAYVRLIGARDFIGRSVREVLPEVADQGFFEILDRVYTSAERFCAEQTLIRLQRVPGGPLENRYVDFIYEPILDANENVTGIFVEGFDVTAHHNAERRLRELNATLEVCVAERTRERDRVWAHSRDLIVVVDARGDFQAVSPAWRRILGHHPDEVVGRNFRDFIHREDIPFTDHALVTALAGEQLTGFENRYVHLNGTSRWISWHTSSEDGLVYAYGRDISAEKAAHKNRQLTRAHLDALFETPYLFQWLISLDGILLTSNATSLAAIGHAQEAAIGKLFSHSPWFAATPEPSQWVAQAVAGAAEGQASRQELQLNLPVGGRRWYDCSIQPLFDDQGRVIAIGAESLESKIKPWASRPGQMPTL